MHDIDTQMLLILLHCNAAVLSHLTLWLCEDAQGNLTSAVRYALATTPSLILDRVFGGHEVLKPTRVALQCTNQLNKAGWS